MIIHFFPYFVTFLCKYLIISDIPAFCTNAVILSAAKNPFADEMFRFAQHDGASLNMTWNNVEDVEPLVTPCKPSGAKWGWRNAITILHLEEVRPRTKRQIFIKIAT